MIDRAFFCHQRKKLNGRERRLFARQSRPQLHKLAKLIAPKLPKGACVGLYSDAFGELPTYPIIQLCRHYGWRPFLPVVQGDKLGFVAISTKTAPTKTTQRLCFTGKRHPLGMSEPLGSVVPVGRLSACFCPLVAIDKQGVRMGMGGGFYDRTLVNFYGITIGYGYDFQVVDHLQKMPWDIAMDYMVTPKRLWVF